jgi:predicted nucleic acid-binding protein
MILIVADTGPINYLIQIGSIEMLATLAQRTVLPESARAELLQSAAPDAVRAWAIAPPAWIEIRSAKQLIEAPDISMADREAITLARELNASVLLMDDQQARRCAASLGVATMGTVALLEVAAARDLARLPAALERLRGTSCFLTGDIIENALHRDAERLAKRASREI